MGRITLAAFAVVTALAGCSSSEAAPPSTTAAETTTTAATVPEGRAEAVEALVAGGFEPAVAECVLDVLTDADLDAADLAEPNAEVEALVAGAIVRCQELNEPLEPDEIRGVLVQTLVDNAGLTAEQAECAVAGIEASGATAAELLNDPERLSALLGEVIPGCIE